MKKTTLQKLITSLHHCIDLSEAIEMAEAHLEDEKQMIISSIIDSKDSKYAMNISLLPNEEGIYENKNIGEAYYNMNFYKGFDFYPETLIEE